MMENFYVIDTSSLVELNKHNPIDIYPSVWNKMEELVKKGRLVAPREVLFEIELMDDQLKDWSREQNKMFVEPADRQIEIVKEILRKYPSLIDINRKYDADPWVIALTVEMVTDPQRTLTEIKRIVVTEEKIRGNRIRIPLICKDYNVEFLDIIGMFREEGWRF